MTSILAHPTRRVPDGAATSPEAGFALYVHWPFCAAKCPYCDFNSHVRPRIDQRRWRAAYLRELVHFGRETAGRPLRSIFFGGGTPSLMEPATVAAIIARASEIWRFEPAIEITLEANPGSAEVSNFEAFREAGVNRLSLGVQAFDEEGLRLLGRSHDLGEAIAAIEMAAALFPRMSFDLIYGRPGQTPRSWERELERALAWVGGHLSAYELTIEPGTAFHALWRSGRLRLPDEETRAALFAITRSLLAARGLAAYEVSNYARPGEVCRHNLVYWRSGDWVGIGPGAHGRLTFADGRVATVTHRRPERWLASVEARGHGEEPRELLDPRTQAMELLLMGLRLAEGVSLAELERRSGCARSEVVDLPMLEALVEAGALRLEGERLCATEDGLVRLDAILPRLLR